MIRSLLIRGLAALAGAAFCVAAHAATLLNTGTIAAANSAAAASVFKFAGNNLSLHANFAYGSGGTTVDAYVQTSFDGGTSWTDVCNFHFTTAAARKAVNLSSLTAVTTSAALTDGSMTNNTCQDGLIGPVVRVKWSSTGTYGGATSLRLDAYSSNGRIYQ